MRAFIVINILGSDLLLGAIALGLTLNPFRFSRSTERVTVRVLIMIRDLGIIPGLGLTLNTKEPPRSAGSG